MANPLAVPTFRAGATDTLAAVDIYKVKSDSVVNSVSDMAKKYDSDLVKSFMGMDKLSISDITNKVLNEDAKSFKDSAVARMQGLSEGAFKGIRELGSTVSSGFGSLTSSITAMLPEMPSLPNLADINIGGLTSVISATNIPQISAISNLLGTTTGIANRFGITDNLAQTSLLSNIINKCSDLGVSGVTSAVVSAVTDRKVLTMVSGMVVAGLVQKSSSRDLQALSNIIGSNQIRMTQPDIIPQYAQSYGNDPSYRGSTKTYGQEWNDIRSAYASLDSSYQYASRSVGQTNSIASFMGGSPTYQQVVRYGAMNSSSNIDKLAILGTLVNKAPSVKEDLGKIYPKSAFNYDNQNTRVVSPLSI